MMTDICVFCAIASGAEKGSVVFENEDFIAFLDKRPLFHGHSLLIPKIHVETLYDLPVEKVNDFFLLTQRIGKAIEESMQAQGSFIAINNRISQSVPHLHIHIVPRNKQDGLKGFFWPRTTYKSEQEMHNVKLLIKKYLEK